MFEGRQELEEWKETVTETRAGPGRGFLWAARGRPGPCVGPATAPGHPRGVLAAFVLEDPDSVPTRTPGATDTPGSEAPSPGPLASFPGRRPYEPQKAGPTVSPGRTQRSLTILNGFSKDSIMFWAFFCATVNGLFPLSSALGSCRDGQKRTNLSPRPLCGFTTQAAESSWRQQNNRYSSGLSHVGGPLAAWASTQEGVLTHLLNQRILRVPL